MSNETNQLFRDGRLITPSHDSLCGISLKVGKLYLISASNSRITLCDYIKEYSKMTIVERRGFAGGYKKGCSCDVRLIIVSILKHFDFGYKIVIADFAIVSQSSYISTDRRMHVVTIFYM